MVRHYSTKSPGADHDRADLEAVVNALNRVLPNQLSDEDHKALVDFVELWNKSGRVPWKEPFSSATEGRTFKLTSPFPADVMKMLANMPDEGASDEDPFRDRDEAPWAFPAGCRERVEDADGKRFWQQHRTRFSRKNLERAFDWRIAAGPAGGCWVKAYGTPDRPFDPAVLLAGGLLGNTLSDKLSDGPCHRCNKWFVKKRAVQKCCSKRCATAFNNTVGVQLRRAAQHEEQLGRARAALKAWKRTERRSEWRQFVSKQAGLTPKFLTRAVNKGELRAPKISNGQEKKRRQR